MSVGVSTVRMVGLTVYFMCVYVHTYWRMFVCMHVRMCMTQCHGLLYIHSFMAHIILVIWSVVCVHIIVSCISTDSHCVSLRQIIMHWKQCDHHNCSVCTPVKGVITPGSVPGETKTLHQFTIYVQHITLHLYTSSLSTYSTLHYTCTPVHYLHTAHYTTPVHQFPSYIQHITGSVYIQCHIHYVLGLYTSIHTCVCTIKHALHAVSAYMCIFCMYILPNPEGKPVILSGYLCTHNMYVGRIFCLIGLFVC